MVLMADMLRSLIHAVQLSGDEYTFSESWEQRDWQTCISLARFHGLTPLLAHGIQTGRIIGVPPETSGILQKDLHKNRMFHHAASSRLREIEALFTEHDIPVVPLKGPRLSDRVYENTGLRPFEDLDLLIEPGTLEQASALLGSLGYAPFKGQANLNRMRKFHFHNQWSHSDTGQCVELHWRAADRHSLPLDVNEAGQSFINALQETPAASAVYLAVHLNKHSIVSDAILAKKAPLISLLHPFCDTRLIWLFDFAYFIAKENVSEAVLMSCAASWKVSDAVRNTCRMTALINEKEKPVPPADSSSGSARVAYWKHLIMNRIEGDLRRPAAFPETPWWLKPSKRFGFRPVRLLDVING